MASGTALRSIFLTDPFRFINKKTRSCSLFDCGRVRVKVQPEPRRLCIRNCSSSSTCDNNNSFSDEQGGGPPQEAVLKAISEVSKTEGRIGQTTNVVIGGTVTEWLALDQKVNSYPTVRGFTAIGTGGDDFVQAMVVAVESVLQEPVPENENTVFAVSVNSRLTFKDRVTQKVSSGGKYVSVNIGPVEVVSSEQVFFFLLLLRV
ncbi:hypothetical protein IFM89_027676 [Coptis chinensis]|uniref:Uncharacterized protein n=1 Tax=Coptis chinensis TaxID=261450 RepID=A0A835MG57_9MAGN|nr:hypothetical protein IFM89_027676 [Coptis chinensis]